MVRLPLSLGLLLLAGGAVQAATSTAIVANPNVTFSTQGVKQVTLQSCNSGGCSAPVTRTIVVLDPMPHIGSAAIPPLVGVGQIVSLTAVTTGRPPLSHTWKFVNLISPDLVATGNPATWTAPALPGEYVAHLDVANIDGSTSSVPVPVTVVPWAFADVPPTYWAWKWIENLNTRGVSTNCGTSPLRFCPDAAMTRGEMAIFLLRAKDGAAYVPPACVTASFADVPCSDPLAPWVEELVRRGVTVGCGNGNYCPSNPVTRDQMAVFLLVTREGTGYFPSNTCPPAPFNDVPCTTPFAPWVKELVTRGVTAGCGSGAYCPGMTVSRAQMSIFISVMFNLPPP
jgi:hypothetical protein